MTYNVNAQDSSGNMLFAQIVPLIRKLEIYCSETRQNPIALAATQGHFNKTLQSSACAYY